MTVTAQENLIDGLYTKCSSNADEYVVMTNKQQPIR